MIYLLIGYMWLFIHRLFEVWPWIGEYRVERVYMLATIAYWAMCVPKTWIRCRSHFGVFFLAATLFVASQISPYVTFLYVEDWFKVLVFYVLVVTTVRNERDLKILVLAFVCVTALYELHSLREYFCGHHVWSGMGLSRMIGVDATNASPNMFGATIVYALPFLLPAWTIARTKWQRAAIIAFAMLAVTCILLTGSRTSFVSLLFLIFIVSALSKYRWLIIPLFLIIPPIIWINMRGDLQDRYMSIIDPSRVQANARSGEGRIASFWTGMNSFAENPLFGAGLGSCRAKTGVATHNLYHQAMGELGISGLIVLISFAWAFFGDLRETRRLFIDREDRDALFLYRICVAASLSCLLLFLVGWGGHNLTRYNWLWYGAFSGAAIQFLRQRDSLIMSDSTSHVLIADDENDGRSDQCHNAPGDSTVSQGEST